MLKLHISGKHALIAGFLLLVAYGHAEKVAKLKKQNEMLTIANQTFRYVIEGEMDDDLDDDEYEQHCDTMITFLEIVKNL